MNILEEVQIYVADRLNADSQLSGLCPFIFENKKDIDYEIKSALGKQGLVGLVMTPKATFAGAFEDKSLAWQIDELEIDIIENVTVNRGKKNGYVTGQDAAMRLFDVLCPLTGEDEGRFNAVSYEEGEDNSLLVNKCVLKCLVHTDTPKGKYTYAVLGGEVLRELYEGTFTWEMFKAFSPSNYNHITDLSVGTAIDKLSAYCCYASPDLSNVVLPNTITQIGDGAFYMNGRLTNVQMKEGITAIGQDCFFACESLRTLEIPSTVQTIGRMAFKVTNDPYGQGLSRIAFKGKTLAQVQAMENYPWGIKDTSIISAELVPPAPDPRNTILTYADGRASELALSGTIYQGHLPDKEHIVAANIGEDVTLIGESAFNLCPELTSVTLPSTSIKIGPFAFNETPITSLDFEDSGLTDIGMAAFEHCERMTSVSLPSTLSSIGQGAFVYCTNLGSVYFAGKSLGQVEAMDNYPWGIADTSIISAEIQPPAQALTRAYYSDGTMVERDVTTITRQTFDQTNLVRIEIGNHVLSVGFGAFSGLPMLSSVEFNEGTTSIIGNLMFNTCSALTQITIPDTVTTIGDSAFWGIPNLTEFTFPDSQVSSIGTAAFNGCSSLSSVAFGESLLEIKAGAFSGCTNLKNFNSNDGVYLNDGIQTIGQNAFNGSGIEKLSFNNLAAMGINSNAFVGCNQLSDVVVRGVTTHEAMSLENYPWGISDENIIRGDRGI